MQLLTILNRVEKCKSFVYQEARWARVGQTAIEIRVRPRAGSRPICSGCNRKGPGYDRLPPRRFEFVPLWNIAVFLVYAARRVDCPTCGVKVEQLPWSDGKNSLTISYRWFLARWARRLSWSEVATVFHTSWDSVFRSVQYAVAWGLAHRELQGIEAIGIDEVQWQRGHQYLTLVYQIDAGCKRLLFVAKDRTEESLRSCFHQLTETIKSQIRHVCSDMWPRYLKVIAEELPKAVNVLDRFHIMQKMNKAIDEVRAEEAKQLKRDGHDNVLKHSRWCLLKRPENLTERQTVKLSELVKCNLRSIKSYLAKQDFERFWEYQSPYWAGRFLQEWITRTLRSGIAPMKKVAETLRRHEPLILNWFRARGQMSSGVVEGLNTKVKLAMRKSYGFRRYQTAQVALYHTLGALPEPKRTHEFC